MSRKDRVAQQTKRRQEEALRKRMEQEAREAQKAKAEREASK